MLRRSLFVDDDTRRLFNTTARRQLPQLCAEATSAACGGNETGRPHERDTSAVLRNK